MNDGVVASVKNNEFVLSLWVEDMDSPREYDDMTVIFYAHKLYSMGDTDVTELGGRYGNWLDLLFGLFDEYYHRKDYTMIYLPVYAYIHSGVSLSTTPFACPWDSGQTGWIVGARDILADNGLTTEQQMYAYMRKQVELLDKYLNGQILSLMIERQKRCSCCGNVLESEVEETLGPLVYREELEQFEQDVLQYIPRDNAEKASLESLFNKLDEAYTLPHRK